jgi:hypothetical protein
VLLFCAFLRLAKFNLSVHYISSTLSFIQNHDHKKHCIQLKRGLGHCTASKPWPDYVLHYTQTIPPLLLLRLHLEAVARKALSIIHPFKWHSSIYILKFGSNVSFDHHCIDQRIYKLTLLWRGRKIVVISIHRRRCDLALVLPTLKRNWMPTLHL